MAQYDPSNNSESKSDLPEGLKSAVDISQIITGCKDKGAKQYQEDSYCTFESPDLTFLVAAVFDGHGGLNGRVASQKVAALSTEYFSNNWQKCKGWTNDEWTTEMTSFYHHLHQKVREEFIQVFALYIGVIGNFTSEKVHVHCVVVGSIHDLND